MNETKKNEPAQVIRILPESILNKTGQVCSTGLQLVVLFEHVKGLPVEVVASSFGYTTQFLDSLAQQGDQLVMVVSRSHADFGYATDQALAGLMRDLRPDVGIFNDDQVSHALNTNINEADDQTRETQKALQNVFGIRDTIFGGPRFPSAKWPDRQLLAPFYIDEKINFESIKETNNPLLPGTSLPLNEYPDMPLVMRLSWPPQN